MFVKSREKLEELCGALSTGNSWAKESSLIVAVYSEKNYDCVLNEREYYLFDTGMAVALLVLRATELSLVAHPIAGYEPEKVRNALGIPKEAVIITLIIVGKHSEKAVANLSSRQRLAELNRPSRKGFEEIARIL
ncbi:MAG: nitroreductase family protein [Thermoproteota archaeon]